MKQFEIFIFILFLIVLAIPSAFADDGAPTGWWTDSEGNNYYGDPPSQPSSDTPSTPSTGYTYTGPSIWERMENAREAQRLRRARTANDQGIEFAKKGNYEKALEYYQKAAAIDPNDAVIQNNVRIAKTTLANLSGNRYYEQGDWNNAVQAYQQSLAYDPNNQVVQQNLANAQSQLQLAENARLAEQQKQAATQQAYQNVQNMVPNLAQDLKSKKPEPKTNSSGPLGFQGIGQKPGGGLDFVGPNQGKRKVPLEEFKNMKPVKPELIERGAMPAGGSKTASGQAEGAKFNGAQGVAVGQIGAGEGGAHNASLGFDTPGVAKEGIKPVELKGLPPPYERDPDIPKERVTPEITDLVEKRTAARDERRKFEAELEKLEKADKKDPVAIVKMKDQISKKQNEEIFFNFSINEKLQKAPDVKRKEK